MPTKSATNTGSEPHNSIHSTLLIKMPHHILTLPLEIRLEIYEYLLDNYDMEDTVGHKIRVEPESFASNTRVDEPSQDSRKMGCHPAILRVCKQIYTEAVPILYATKVFVANDHIDIAKSAYDQIIPNLPIQHLQHIKDSVRHEVWRYPLDRCVTEAPRIMKELPSLKSYNIEVNIYEAREHHGLSFPRLVAYAAELTEKVIEMAREVLPSHPNLSMLYQEIPQETWQIAEGQDEIRDGFECVFIFVDKKMAPDDGYEWVRSQSRRVSPLLADKITSQADIYRLCYSIPPERALTRGLTSIIEHHGSFIDLHGAPVSSNMQTP
jgi:hypothetical protein